MSMNTKLNIESIIDGSIEKVKLAESVQESLNKLESKTDIVASQIFLELHTAYDDFQVFSHKRGYEAHNRKVCQRLIENCFTHKTPNNEVFFVTINGLRDGVPYMETAIIESQASEAVRASFVKGNIVRESSIAASIGILSIDVETLRSYVESGEDVFYWKYISTLVPSIDAIGSEGESDVYVTEFTFEEITTNGRAVNVSPKLVSAIYNNRIIVIPGKNGNFIATNTFSLPSEAPVGIQMKIQAGVVIYDVVLRAVGPAPQTVQTGVRAMNLLSGTLNTINGAGIASGVDMPLVSSISLNGQTYTPSKGAVDLGEINVEEVKFANDLTGVAEATPEMFTYRPSAGDKSVRDESAVIRRIKGNSSVWGQLISGISNDSMVSSVKEGDAWILTPIGDSVSPGSSSWSAGWSTFNAPHTLNTDHVYLYCVTFTKISKRTDIGDFDVKSTVLHMRGVSKSLDADFGQRTTVVMISKPGASGNIFLSLNDCVTKIENPMLIDLTCLFDAGNEPTTYEEFRKYYPDAYYPYCEPEIRAMRATGIETVGFNQWDEKWENGTFNTETGENISNNQIRCKNLIRIFQNTYYSLSIGDKNLGIWAMFYDDNQNILQPINLNSSVNRNCLYISPSGDRNVFLTPENASWMKFYIPQEYGSTTYKGDICINLSHSGVRNGEYESYEKNTLLLPEISKYFPNGMHGIGDMYDEIIDGLAIQRIGIVDLGSLIWRRSLGGNTLGGWYTLALQGKMISPSNTTEKANALCDKYTILSINDLHSASHGLSVEVGGIISVYDTDYTDVDADIFTNSLNGVLFYYQLAKPIYTPIDEPMQLAYKVDDFGTERIISDLPSTPFKADIVYQFNAEGRIRDNSRNIEKLENNINNVQDKLDSKQDTLISGTNIKFINGESVLGEGNLVIDGNNIFVGNDLANEAQYLNTTIKQYGELIESKYVKSETGIPASDLSEEVQTSLGKADNSVRLTTGGGDINPGYNGDKQFYIQKVNGVQTLKIEMLTKNDVLSGKYTGNNGNSPFVGADIVWDLYNNAYDLADSKEDKFTYILEFSLGELILNNKCTCDNAGLVNAINNRNLILVKDEFVNGVPVIKATFDSTTKIITFSYFGDSNNFYKFSYKYDPDNNINNNTLPIDSLSVGINKEMLSTNLVNELKPYVVDFTISDLERCSDYFAPVSISTDIASLYNAITQKQVIHVRNESGDSKGYNIITNCNIVEESTNVYIIDCEIPTATGSWKLYGLRYDKTNESQVCALTSSTVKFYPSTPYELDFTTEDLFNLSISDIDAIEYDSYNLAKSIIDGRNIIFNDTVTGSNTMCSVGGTILNNTILLSLYTSNYIYILSNLSIEPSFDETTGNVIPNTITRDNMRIINLNGIYNQMQYIKVWGSGIKQIVGNDSLVYALPGTADGDEDVTLLGDTTVKTINNTKIYRSSSTDPTNIYTYYPISPVTVVGTADRAASYMLTPNILYNWGDYIPINISIVLGRPYENVVNEYVLQFKTTDTVPTVVFPSSVKWVSGNAPVLEENKIYQISIINNLGTVLSWDNA